MVGIAASPSDPVRVDQAVSAEVLRLLQPHKYAVASYTSGLHYNSVGSLSIYLAREQPSGVPEANWLPVPSGPFNIALRVYGPEGDVENNTYVPPALQKALIPAARRRPRL